MAVMSAATDGRPRDENWNLKDHLVRVEVKREEGLPRNGKARAGMDLHERGSCDAVTLEIEVDAHGPLNHPHEHERGGTMKAPVAHDGYLGVAKRLLAWGTVLTVLCIASQWALLFAMGHGHGSADRVRFDLANIHNALRAYRAQTGAWPPEKTWSEALINKRILKQEPMDPWDHPFRYRLESTDGGEPGPRVSSVGPDGAEGTEDDVELAEKRRP